MYQPRDESLKPLKVGFALSGISMALGLLAKGLTGNNAAAMLAFLGSLGLGVALMVRRRIQVARYLREQVGLPPEKSMAVALVRIRQRQIGLMQVLFPFAVFFVYVLLSLSALFALSSSVVLLAILLLSMLLVPVFLFTHLWLSAQAALSGEKPSEQGQGAPAARRILVMSSLLALILSITTFLAATFILVLSAGDSWQALKSLYLLVALGLLLWGISLMISAGALRKTSGTFMGISLATLLSVVVPITFAVAGILIFAWFLWLR